jgi:HD superfamily phosphohydrolase
MRQVVSSTIDADLLDYLRRDAYHAGVAQTYDERLLSYFAVEPVPDRPAQPALPGADRPAQPALPDAVWAEGQLVLQMSKHGMERPDARSETVQLLRLRYFLTERIYYHHTKVAAGAMVSKAVELAQEYGALGEDELLELTDAGLLHRLTALPRAEAPDPVIGHLVRALERRELLKRGYVVSALTVPPEARRDLVTRFHADRLQRRRAEEEVAAALDCDPGEVVLYCPALTVMKEAAVLVRLPAGVRPLNQADGGPPSEIRALEERYAQLWRFYLFVPRAHTARAADVGRETFGFPSEHRSG